MEKIGNVTRSSLKAAKIYIYFTLDQATVYYTSFIQDERISCTHIWRKRYTVGDNEGKKIYGNNFFKSMLMKQILGYTMVI